MTVCIPHRPDVVAAEANRRNISTGFPCSIEFHCHACCHHYPGESRNPHTLDGFQTTAFPVIMAGRHSQRHFEACSVFTSHCGPHDSLIPIRDLFREYFSSFVTSFTAPGASGWSAVASRDLHPEKLNAFQGIHNNLVENAIRPTAVGKKNWLFFGSPEAGQTSAVIYSLIETCRKLSINPSDYLRDVLEALPTMQQAEAASWTPARWKSSREQTA